MLLWRCPLCHVDDALKHKAHWFRKEEVECTYCGTAWEVRRVIGDDFFLIVVHGEPSMVGQRRPLAEWYDLMKASLSLVARKDSSLHLEPGEELYVQGRQAQLFLEEDNPLYGSWAKEEAPWEKEGDLGQSFLKRCDRGRLSLTSQRFVWRGERRMLTFWLKKVNSAYTEVHRYFSLLYGLRIYKFRFQEESILKWLTYTALVARRIEQVYHHRISLSNY